MRKHRKGLVHPSPSPPAIISDYLSFLPATILALIAALSPQDSEVLAYLISCSTATSTFATNNRKTSQGSSSTKFSGGKGDDHPSSFNCNCFRCYKSYWERWDSSPNRQLIHEIIDAFEDGSFSEKKNKSVKNKKERRDKRGGCAADSGELKLKESKLSSGIVELVESESAGETKTTTDNSRDDVDDVVEKGTVRGFFSFIGEKIWGA